MRNRAGGEVWVRNRAGGEVYLPAHALQPVREVVPAVHLRQAQRQGGEVGHGCAQELVAHADLGKGWVRERPSGLGWVWLKSTGGVGCGRTGRSLPVTTPPSCRMSGVGRGLCGVCGRGACGVGGRFLVAAMSQASR